MRNIQILKHYINIDSYYFQISNNYLGAIFIRLRLLVSPNKDHRIFKSFLSYHRNSCPSDYVPQCKCL